jgi:hypothetical protein
MSEHPTPTSNVSPFPGQDQDVAEVEELLERLLKTSVEADVTWSIVRERIGFDQGIAPLRPRRRPRRVLALAIAAALMMSGVALASVAHLGQSPTQPSLHDLDAPHGVAGTPVSPDTGLERPALAPTPAPADAGGSSTLTPPASPDTDGESSSGGTTQGSDPQQGQDQSSDQPSGQDQPKDQTAPTDGGDVQSAASASTDGNEGPSPSAQATSDQQS